MKAVAKRLVLVAIFLAQREESAKCDQLTAEVNFSRY